MQKLHSLWLLLLLLSLSSLPLASSSSTQKCYSSLPDIESIEQLVPADDYAVPRTYILCPHTDFYVSSLHHNNQYYYGAALPDDFHNNDSPLSMINLRPYLRLQCGDHGDRDDNCRIVGGDVQLEGTHHHFGIRHDDGDTSSRLDNVWIVGLTFVEPRRHMVLIDRPGDIVFLDCAFQVR
jgi:hypothetical protein